MVGAEGPRGGQGRYRPGGDGEQSLILEDPWIFPVRLRSLWVARVTDTWAHAARVGKAWIQVEGASGQLHKQVKKKLSVRSV